MAASSVRDLHGAHSVVAADHFSKQEGESEAWGVRDCWSHNLLVRILDCWRVGLREGPLDKPVHQTRFPNSWTKSDDQMDNSLSLSLSLQSHLLPRRWPPCSRCSTPALLCCDLALCDLTLLSTQIPPSYISFLWKTVNFNLLQRLTGTTPRRWKEDKCLMFVYFSVFWLM